jgi:hypothetical protein
LRLNQVKPQKEPQNTALPGNARFVLEKVDMLSSLGVTQTAPEEEDACPPVYCTTPLASWAITIAANALRRAK